MGCVYKIQGIQFRVVRGGGVRFRVVLGRGKRRELHWVGIYSLKCTESGGYK